MKNLLAHKLRLVSVIVFLMGAVTASLAYYANSRPQHAAQGFTLYSTMTTTPKGGDPTKTGTRVRYQKSDGSFKQVTIYHSRDGNVIKTDILFGQPNRGVFLVSEKAKTIEFLSGLSPKSIVLSEEDLHRDHRNIVREEKVMDYKVFVARLGDDGDGSSYTELYHAPALMGFQIKTVSVSAATTLTIEPTKIVVGDPSDNDLADIPKYPIVYNLYEEKIKTVEERGGREAAQKMREILQIAKNP